MYATEAVMLFIAQTVFGIALGILFYSVSYSVRTGIMGMSGYSAFTTDPIVLGATADPPYYRSYILCNNHHTRIPCVYTDHSFVKKAKEKKITPLFRFGGRYAFTFTRQ